VSNLVGRPPYGPRDDEALLRELNALSRHHQKYCPRFARIWPDWSGSGRIEDLPYLHVGLFKRDDFMTDFPGVRRGRTLRSSGSGGPVSRIALDEESSALQSGSAAAIFGDVLGPHTRPLLVLDRAQSLRERGGVSARLAAAMSLRPLASGIHFLFSGPEPDDRIDWNTVEAVLEGGATELLVYGFTSILWDAWASRPIPAHLRPRLASTRIAFVHSGGWKRLESRQVDPRTLERELLATSGRGSRILDFYGLVEQVGLVFPLCEHGSRHVPVWADVIVRSAVSLDPLDRDAGLIQLLNVLARGTPSHSVLTEDLGRINPGPCPCGRSGKRFDLLGRVPKAELRGCSNV
jgi:hypothetical protein